MRRSVILLALLVSGCAENPENISGRGKGG